MDIISTAAWINPDDEFTDAMWRTHKALRVDWVPAAGGVYVYVEGQGYPEFYLREHVVVKHIPDTKFKLGDTVQACNGKGPVYTISRIAKDRWGGTYYVFDNGSVDVRKRARSGRHEVVRANRGYRKVD